MQCSAPHCTPVDFTSPHVSAMQYTALHCTSPYCAVHCTSFDCTSPHCSTAYTELLQSDYYTAEMCLDSSDSFDRCDSNDIVIVVTVMTVVTVVTFFFFLSYSLNFLSHCQLWGKNSNCDKLKKPQNCNFK